MRKTVMSIIFCCCYVLTTSVKAAEPEYEVWSIDSGTGLACAIILCLYSAASGRPSICKKPIREYWKKVLKGDARAFLRTCPNVESKYIDFATQCTEPRIYSYLYERLSNPDSCLGCPNYIRGRGLPNIPPSCISFLNEHYAGIDEELAKIPEELRDSIPEISLRLLPVQIMAWVQDGNPDETNGEYYRPGYEWVYLDYDDETGEYDMSKVPPGYTITYDVNLRDPDTGELGVYYEDPPCPVGRSFWGGNLSCRYDL